jgi:hypothetical protein
MLLNRVEYALMNNPARAAIQRRVEARRLLRMGGPLPGGAALEMGRGIGAELILDVFGAATVDAFDLDQTMVMRGRRRLCARGSRVRLWVGDASAIAEEVLRRVIVSPATRAFLQHPQHDRFDADEFLLAMRGPRGSNRFGPLVSGVSSRGSSRFGRLPTDEAGRTSGSIT